MKLSAGPVLFAVMMLGSLFQPAAAFPMQWLDQSPARYFTDEDWNIAEKAADKALDTAKDGETVSWENPASGAYGTYTPVSTSTEQDMTCREVKVVNHAHKLDASSWLKFCQKPDGKWAIASDALPK